LLEAVSIAVQGPGAGCGGGEGSDPDRGLAHAASLQRYNCRMWNDLRFGLRTLRRNPVFTIVAVLSLALGIGANTSIFSLLSQVMFRMLPVAEPERLVIFHTEGQRNGWSTGDERVSVLSYPMYKDL